MDEQYTSDATEFQQYMANHHRIMQTEQAHTQVKGDGVTVAVTDTGVDYGDLSDNIWRNELEFGLTPDGEDMTIDDDTIHGLMIVTAGTSQNLILCQIPRASDGSHVALSQQHTKDGVVGVAPEARVIHGLMDIRDDLRICRQRR